MADWDQAEGKLKEGAGELTGDEDLEREGEAQGAFGDVKEGARDLGDSLGDAKDKLTGD